MSGKVLAISEVFERPLLAFSGNLLIFVKGTNGCYGEVSPGTPCFYFFKMFPGMIVTRCVNIMDFYGSRFFLLTKK